MKEKLAVSVILMTVVLVPTNVSEAKDFAQADPQRQEWFKGLERPDVPPTARPGQRSCCKQGDVVDTKFRVDKPSGADVWLYLERNDWKVVPPEKILDKQSIDGKP